MTADDRQTAINHNAVTAAAEQLTATGWVGDSHRFVEALLLTALAEGYRRIEKVPALRGPGATREAIDDALRAAEEAVRASREKRKKPVDPVRALHELEQGDPAEWYEHEHLDHP